jgi:hypothetical protein
MSRDKEKTDAGSVPPRGEQSKNDRTEDGRDKDGKR